MTLHPGQDLQAAHDPGACVHCDKAELVKMLKELAVDTGCYTLDYYPEDCASRGLYRCVVCRAHELLRRLERAR